MAGLADNSGGGCVFRGGSAAFFETESAVGSARQL